MATNNGFQRSRRGQMLIGMIIVIAIILAMTAYSLRPHGVTQTAMERGEMTPCIAYTGQIREAIMMYKQDNGTYPPDLASLSKQGVTPEMYSAPCTFGYDSSTGALTPPNMNPSAPPAPLTTGSYSSSPPSPAASPSPQPGGGGGTYIPPMAGTVGVHIPASVTGGGPSNDQRGGGGNDNN